MNRIILTGALALAVAVPGLMAQPKPKSKAELEALQAMFTAQTPDARIAAAENVLTKFADTEFKSVALFFETSSYEAKGDYENTIVYGERTVEADPKQFLADIILGKAIVQHTKEFDLDRDEKLAKVDKYANAALEQIKVAQKPNPAITDAQWEAAKKDATAQSHEILGMANMVRKKYDAADKEFHLSLESAEKPDAATMVRLGIALRNEGKLDEAIAQFDKVMAAADTQAQVRQVAQAERVRTIQKKGPAAGTAPAAPAAAPAGGAPASTPAPSNPTPPAPKQ